MGGGLGCHSLISEMWPHSLKHISNTSVSRRRGLFCSNRTLIVLFEERETGPGIYPGPSPEVLGPAMLGYIYYNLIPLYRISSKTYPSLDILHTNIQLTLQVDLMVHYVLQCSYSELVRNVPCGASGPQRTFYTTTSGMLPYYRY